MIRTSESRPVPFIVVEPMQLVRPAAAHLEGYIAALEQGWSADNLGGEAAARRELAALRRDPALHLERMVDREAKGPPIVLPDGSSVTRLPNLQFWLWDGEFCGSIGLRWQPGTGELPPHVLGHVGYAVVPWKRRRGYATQALAQLLPVARREGQPYVDLTTDPGNVASQRVIEANSGVLVGRFTKPPSLGGSEGLRYRIPLA